MRKVYKSKLRGFNVYVPIGDELCNIEFKKGYIYYTVVGCMYVTEDVEIQKALEAHHKFNYQFWTDDKEEVVVEVKEEVQDEPKKVKRYKTKE